MSGVRSTYIVTLVIGQMLCLFGAIVVPVWVTPGNYWWTVFLLMTFLGDGYMLGRRVDMWEGKP